MVHLIVDFVIGSSALALVFESWDLSKRLTKAEGERDLAIEKWKAALALHRVPISWYTAPLPKRGAANN